ncbi:hypothetical protein HHL16_24695 [Pseudoflavitalea sp. G-6-1-2]|uniref:hypothetical protein n=1 Tax=Pseudoflavitalea sp. G-6-1-2 TaxID=2728841 RepID=UPI00146DA737|nr:hypothetical protein [Pseudoflavitalea sp. G-6-1-2]NML24100.1 hypothetical protein [Pseudoflavitalea sp. G-6-1-2]
MELAIKSKVPSVTELQSIVKEKLAGKYACDIVHDRWTISFKADKKCLLVKKSNIIGVAIFIDEEDSKLDIAGIVPNYVLDQSVFKIFIARMLLNPAWNKLEAEVAEVLRSKLS